MPAAPTGQKSAISLVTSGFSLVTTSITPPSFVGDSFEQPNLALDPRACMPMEPSDLPKPGMIEVEFEDDESIDLEGALLLKQNAVITYRAPAGLTNGATDTYANAFIVSVTRAQLTTGSRRIGKLSIQVRSYPTRAAAS